ncbi:MAG TPA: helix-turn-helix domain-containing protein [Streptosporangiaceae bacterium]|nr:helix-turn-helix domain-containing protein [Streptosporangiaceae bacterium]
MSIGDALAAARREAGLTITQVSQRTCIRETIVRGIERGDYSACGGDFYARGHIRSIARAVGLDPDDLVREYDATQAAPKPITAADVFQPFTPVKLKERRRPNWSIVLLAGLIAVLGIAGFRLLGSHHSPGPSKPTASTQTDHTHKKAKAKTAPVVAAPTHVRVTLVALPGAETWYELTSSTGRMISEGYVGGIYPSRATKTEPDTITVQLGNPGGATLYLNGVRQTLITNQPETLVCTKTSCTQTTTA